MKPPASIRLEAATVCQLKCPLCPTAGGEVGKSLGSGLLSPERFARFLADHPYLEEIELSNWGEIFLNRKLPELMRIAREAGVAVHASNGANLNHLSEEAVEAIVRYRLRTLTCSIDGTSQETYGRYRRGGNLQTVLQNVDRINAMKRRFRTPLPRLTWQFVIFEHNAHELEIAREMARVRNMKFYAKSNWDDFYERSEPSLGEAGQKVQAALGYRDRKELAERTGQHALRGVCRQLWLTPQVNFDGRMLGCCVNYWKDFGNVFEDGLTSVFQGEKLEYAREMLQGRKAAREDIACSSCSVYQHIRENESWLKPSEVEISEPNWKRWLKRRIHPDLLGYFQILREWWSDRKRRAQ
ncbi:hypothetical protein ABS71_09480 [bacterium SCN 62-11]|nr:SPASM domain-containing protein [Candidatus Eremiobacteraeota bacterium]ODT68776.1 MAG: hypothetical protein ABS71_09480 [bacterium SCN 62-11]